MQSRYSFLQEKKKKKWPYIISGIIAGILVATAVVWVGMNEWNIDKSIEELRDLTEVKQIVDVDKTEEANVDEPVIEEPKQEIPIVEEPVVEEVDMSGAKGYIGNEVLPRSLQ